MTQTLASARNGRTSGTAPVTVTPGIREPDGSVTVPKIPPVVNWAITTGWLNQNRAIAQTRTLALKQALFVMTWLPSRHVAMPLPSDVGGSGKPGPWS